MKELKEDYSGLSREEKLDLAEQYLSRGQELGKTGQKDAVFLIHKSMDLFEQIHHLQSYITARLAVIKVAKSYSKIVTAIVGNLDDYLSKTLDFCKENFSHSHDIHIDVIQAFIGYYCEVHQFDKVIEWSDLQKSLIEKYHPNDIEKKCKHIYMNSCNFYCHSGDYTKSIDFGLKAIQQLEKVGNKHLFLEVYMTLSSSYFFYDDPENALLMANKALVTNDELGEEGSVLHTAEIYSKISGIYYQAGDHHQEVLYLRKALEICKKNLGEHKQTALVQLNLGSGLYFSEAYEEALYHLKSALSVQKKILPAFHSDIALSNYRLSFYYEKHEEYTTALEYAKQALEIMKKLYGEKHPLTIQCTENVTWITSSMNRTLPEVEQLKENILHIEETFGKTHHKTIHAYIGLAQVYLLANNTEKAISTIQQVEANLREDSIWENMEVLGVKKIAHDLPRLAQLKIQTYFRHYSKKNKSPQILLQVIEACKQLITLADRIRISYHNEVSKLNLVKYESSLIEKGVFSALKMYQLTADFSFAKMTFFFSEKAKSLLLLDSLQMNQAKTTDKVPEQLFEKEKEMKRGLTFLDKKIQQLLAEKEQIQLQKYQDKFFHLHQSYTAFLQELETNYPDYYQLKYDTKTITPMKLQSVLESNQLVISYFLGKDKLYIFVVTPDEFEVIDLQLPTDFEVLIQEFMDTLTRHQFAVFKEKSYQLYQLLIVPIRDFIVDDFGFGEEELKQVFVIPHGALSYVPFEALIGGEQPLSRSVTIDKVGTTLSTVTDLDNSLNVWNGLDYLIHHCEISYHYSATLLYRHLLKKQTPEELPNSFAGFAPIYDTAAPTKSVISISSKTQLNDALQQSARAMQSWVTRSDAIRSDGTWVSLPHSETEAKSIAELFEGKGLEAKTFLREKASKESFSDAVKRFKFLLVAAHGLVNDEKTALSGLVFYPSEGGNKKREAGSGRQEVRGELPNLTSDFSLPSSKTDSILSMEETHHLDLQADLVVLSSCESGIGTLHKGEGMMAVNRGFLAAGANNVVSTLFKVYDKPSSLLTQYFFEEILEGEEYAAALRTAKLKLMKQLNIDPKSWSGFVLIGG